MIICEFCVQLRDGDKCGFGLKIPKNMSCREFEPGIERFCSNPGDFASTGQILQMARFFGIKGREMKKVQAVATLAGARLNASNALASESATAESD